MLAGEWVAKFCEAHGLDWEQLTKAERFKVTMQVPCTIRCWRVGGPVEVGPGERCPECGKERLPRSRYEVLVSTSDSDSSTNATNWGRP